MFSAMILSVALLYDPCGSWSGAMEFSGRFQRPRFFYHPCVYGDVELDEFCHHNLRFCVRSKSKKTYKECMEVISTQRRGHMRKKKRR